MQQGVTRLTDNQHSTGYQNVTIPPDWHDTDNPADDASDTLTPFQQAWLVAPQADNPPADVSSDDLTPEQAMWLSQPVDWSDNWSFDLDLGSGPLTGDSGLLFP